MQIDHDLLLGLEHLSLHSWHLLKSRWKGWRRVGIIIVIIPIVLNVVVGNTVPHADHLQYEL
jgi:t-SNARE complex subunit (syntaxin)